MNRKKGILFGLRKKAIFYMTIIISVVFLATYTEISKVMSDKTCDSLSIQYNDINEKNLLSFHNIYDEVNQLSESITKNEYVQKSLGSKSLNQNEQELMKRGFTNLNKSYLDSYLIIDNKEHLYSSEPVSLDMDKFKNSELYRNLGNEYSKTILLWARDTIFGTYDMKLFAIRYIQDMDNKQKPGILILELNDRVFNKINNNLRLKQLVYMIVDTKQQVCFQQKPKSMSFTPQTQYTVVNKAVNTLSNNENRKNLSKGMIVSDFDTNTGYAVITYAPAQVTNQVIREIQSLIAIIFGLAYAVLFFSIIVYTKKITDPIKLLSNTMEEFDDTKLKEVLTLNTNTELDSIADAYNCMVQRVRQLMRDVQIQERELRKSELSMLLYQIRPHFLYNTLDTIYMLARIQKEETIMKMIQELSKYLRIHLNNGREEYEIKQELEQVSSYLEIQKIRNSSLFEYEITCEEELENVKIMKIILQPIVENCIKHGFRDMYEGGKIWIHIFSKEDNLVICVVNNGASIEEKELDKLNRLEKTAIEQIDQLIDKRQGGFGIYNVVKRLRLRYEGHVRFFYRNKDDGAECVIKIEKCAFTYNN